MDNLVYCHILSFCSWKQLFTYRSINKKINKFCTNNITNQQKILIKNIIKNLNILGPTYQGGMGMTYYTYDDDFCNNDDDFNLVNKLLSKKHIIIKNYKTITKKDFHNVVDHINSHGIHYDKKYMNRLTEIKVPFEKVTVMYKTNTWYGKLHEWYNLDTISHYDRLPRLKTRKYIKIIESFMCIEIDAHIKGSPITLDDVLFATRGLMVDCTRLIDGGYKIVKIKNNNLFLEPMIDNFSS